MNRDNANHDPLSEGHGDIGDELNVDDLYEQILRRFDEDQAAISAEEIQVTCDEIQQRFRREKRQAAGQSLLKDLVSFYLQQLLQARHDSHREIRAILGIVVERFRACGGAVFLNDCEQLICVVSHFGIARGERIPLDMRLFDGTDEFGARMAASLHLSDHHRQEVFPLYTPISQLPLGCVMLEWSEDELPLSDAEREACKVEILKLVVSLLSRHRTSPHTLLATPWAPFVAGWTFKHFLTCVCERIVNALENEFSDSHFSATLWTVDWAEKRLWVRATYGFDEEYHCPDGTSLPWGQGLVWRCAQAQRQTFILEEDPKSSAFYRKDKVQRFRISKILGIPIHRRDDCSGQASTVLMIYHFGDATRNPVPFPLEEVSRELGILLGGWLENYHRMRHEAAVGYARWKLEESRSTPLVDQDELSASNEVPIAPHHPRSILWNTFRDVLVTCLKPDGCSIFLCERPATSNMKSMSADSADLALVATTGVNEPLWDDEGQHLRIGPPSIMDRYRSDDDRHRRSLMMYLYRHPQQAPIRIQSLLGWQQSIDDGELELPLNPGEEFPSHCSDLMEQISPNTRDRRFLATVIKHPRSVNPRGVVRLVRSSRSRPFTEDDARTLDVLCEFFQKSGYDWESLPSRGRVHQRAITSSPVQPPALIRHPS